MKRIAVITTLIVAAVFVAGFSAAGPGRISVEYTVRTGDTVWDIAGLVKEKYGDPRDIREIAYYIAEDNGGADIQPGKRLIITVHPETEE